MKNIITNIITITILTTIVLGVLGAVKTSNDIFNNIETLVNTDYTINTVIAYTVRDDGNHNILMDCGDKYIITQFNSDNTSMIIELNKNKKNVINNIASLFLNHNGIDSIILNKTTTLNII
ncbi:MAG: hypothetical protein ACRCX2_03410 [Paraclostridium sp.]